MQVPPIPFNEASRIRGLIKLDVLDTDPEERFDRITSIAKELFNVPIALLTLIDAKRQWFKSKQGLDLNETSRDVSICGHAIARPVSEDMSQRIFEVPDALQDERFFDNPLIVGKPNMRSYAGFVLQSHEEYNLGTLCIIDTKPRRLSSAEKQSLIDFGMIAQNALQSLRHEDKDLHTGLYNRRGFLSITDHVVENSKKQRQLVSLAYFEISNFKSLVQKYGKLIDLEILGNFVNLLKSTFENSDVMARIGENKFAVLSSHNKNLKFDILLEQFKQKVDSSNMQLQEKFQIKYTSDVITSSPEYLEVSGRLLDLVDKKIYESNFSFTQTSVT